MEDNGRELDPNPVNTPPVKDEYPGSNKLTIMLIGSVGKIRSFKISRKLILFMSIFFSIYIVISLIVFYLYFNLYASHKVQSNNLQNLEAELGEKIKTLEKNNLYIKVLEDYRKGLDKADTGTTSKKAAEPGKSKVKASSKAKSQRVARKKSEKKPDPGATRNKTPEPVKPKEKAPGEIKSKEVADRKKSEEKAADSDTTQKKTPEQVSPEVKVPEPTSPEVSLAGEKKARDTDTEETVKGSMEVKDIKFRKSDSELILDFVLANKLTDKKKVEGYIHIIVMDKNNNCSSEWNNAYNKLSDGFPINYKHGQQFLIQRFRPYQRKYKLNSDSELPSFIRIIVYDQPGQKILEKEFTVTDESANEPS